MTSGARNRPDVGSASRRSAPPKTPSCTLARRTSSRATAASADASPGAPNLPASSALPTSATSPPRRRDSRRSAPPSATTTTRPPRSKSPGFVRAPPRPRRPGPRTRIEPTTRTPPSPRCVGRSSTPGSGTGRRRGRRRRPSRPRSTDPQPPPGTFRAPSRIARTREARRDASPPTTVDFARRRRRPRSAGFAAILSTSLRPRRD